ncbi:outer membrane lipoprotein chaperone LolA [Ramlibacter rhizophilus]|uniref:Outer-membrane lipoprotein carrier protein n=1 Tax=Ramlibacter rhizophilus TaxID=1781167 RepID=A0A4Z0BTX4_9BURK|nr:outer membrane lipoprotein chaperone LolA [Ramlibacter rhizophilus]TFZ01698.1 outer membrane lipoprotein chaperone LolA [Ramlibacter rhizophilus]
MKKVLASLLLAAACMPAFADGLKSLENFLRDARSGRAEFTQVVTSPPRQGEAARSKTSRGTFEFQRPSRFRFDYTKPFPQTLVADGQTLWMHDPDLNQVTARKQDQVLAATPAAIIAAAPDLQALQRDFELKAAPAQGGLEWVEARPRQREGQLDRVRVGFRGDQLAALEILDSFGQRSVISFERMELNPPLAARTFQFTPPPGADVIRQ